MATVIAEWTPNDPAEGVTHYNLFKNGALAGQATAPPFSFQSIPVGVAHTYGVQAENNDPAPDNVSDIAEATFTAPRGKPSKPGGFTVHL